jgi:hypothetical protein
MDAQPMTVLQVVDEIIVHVENLQNQITETQQMGSGVLTAQDHASLNQYWAELQSQWELAHRTRIEILGYLQK